MKRKLIKISVILLVAIFLLSGDNISAFAKTSHCCCKDDDVSTLILKKEMNCCMNMDSASDRLDFIKSDQNLPDNPIVKKYSSDLKTNFISNYPNIVKIYSGNILPPVPLLYSDLNIINSLLRI